MVDIYPVARSHHQFLDRVDISILTGQHEGRVANLWGCKGVKKCGEWPNMRAMLPLTEDIIR